MMMDLTFVCDLSRNFLGTSPLVGMDGMNRDYKTKSLIVGCWQDRTNESTDASNANNAKKYICENYISQQAENNLKLLNFHFSKEKMETKK